MLESCRRGAVVSGKRGERRELAVGDGEETGGKDAGAMQEGGVLERAGGFEGDVEVVGG